MNKLLLALTAILGAAAPALANGCPGGPGCGSPGPRIPFFRQSPVPAFQAAPWYLYWPYQQHFMTPAPMQGAFYAPPGGGAGGMVNPYFPAPQYAPQYAAPSAMPAPAAMPSVAPATPIIR